MPIYDDILAIPIASLTIEKAKDNVSTYSSSSYAILQFMGAVPLLYKMLFYHLKQRGILVYVWVLNDKADYELAYNYGANGIMTDRPALAAAYFKKKGISVS